MEGGGKKKQEKFPKFDATDIYLKTLEAVRVKYKTIGEVDERLEQLRGQLGKIEEEGKKNGLTNSAIDKKKEGNNRERRHLSNLRSEFLKNRKSHERIEPTLDDPSPIGAGDTLDEGDVFGYENMRKQEVYSGYTERQNEKRVAELQEKIQGIMKTVSKIETAERQKRGAQKSAETIKNAAHDLEVGKLEDQLREIIKEQEGSVKDKIMAQFEKAKEKTLDALADDFDYSDLSLTNKSVDLGLKNYEAGERVTQEGEEKENKTPKINLKTKKSDPLEGEYIPNSKHDSSENKQQTRIIDGEVLNKEEITSLNKPSKPGADNETPPGKKKVKGGAYPVLEQVDEQEKNVYFVENEMYIDTSENDPENPDVRRENIGPQNQDARIKKAVDEGIDSITKPFTEEYLIDPAKEAISLAATAAYNAAKKTGGYLKEGFVETGKNMSGQITEYSESEKPNAEQRHKETMENVAWRESEEEKVLTAEDFQNLRKEYSDQTGFYRQLKKSYEDANLKSDKSKIRKEMFAVSERIQEIASERRKYSLMKLVSKYDGAKERLGEKALRHFELQDKIREESGVDEIGAAKEFFKAAGLKLSDTRVVRLLNKMPTSAKITLSALAGAALSGGGAGTFASRLAGGVVGFATGKSVGEFSRWLLRKNTENLGKKYKRQISSKTADNISIDQLEKTLNKKMSALKRTEKREMWLSSGIAFASALGAGISTRESGIGQDIFDKFKSENNYVPNNKLNIGSDYPIKADYVEASSKGSIQTFVDLKDSLEDEYPNEKTRPQIVKDVLAMRAIDLAEKYGFYKPGEVAESSMILAGEKLGISKDGKLEYIKTNGEKIILEGDGDFSKREGAWGDKGGKMFDYQGVKEVSDSIKSNPELVNREYLETCESLKGFVGCDIREGEIIKSTIFNEGVVAAHIEKLINEGKINEKEFFDRVYEASKAYDWKTKWDIFNSKPGQPIEIEVSELSGFLTKFYGVTVTEAEIRSVLPEGAPVYYSEESTIKLVDLYAEGSLTKEMVLSELRNGLNIEKVESPEVINQEQSQKDYPRVNPETRNMMVDQRNLLIEDLNSAILDGNVVEATKLKDLIAKLDQEMYDLNRSDTPAYGQSDKYISDQGRIYNANVEDLNTSNIAENPREIKNKIYELKRVREDMSLNAFKESGLLPGLDFSNFKDIQYVQRGELVSNPIGRLFGIGKKMIDVHTFEMTTRSGETVRFLINEAGTKMAFDGKNLLGGNYPRGIDFVTTPFLENSRDVRNLVDGLDITPKNMSDMAEFINNQAESRNLISKTAEIATSRPTAFDGDFSSYSLPESVSSLFTDTSIFGERGIVTDRYIETEKIFLVSHPDGQVNLMNKQSGELILIKDMGDKIRLTTSPKNWIQNFKVGNYDGVETKTVPRTSLQSEIEVFMNKK